MNSVVAEISILNLSFLLIPVGIIIIIFYQWSVSSKTTLYAFLRMIIQLLLVGYILNHLFANDHLLVVAGILAIMLLVATWIALRATGQKNQKIYIKIFISITIGTGLSLPIVTQVVLDLEPWFSIKQTIPLASMIIANAMNTVSLAAERFESELENGKEYLLARNTALHAAMIPITNMLFAVGIVSLPGFMTGQILSGIEPLIAVRYQIMIMIMVFISSASAAISYLAMSRVLPVLNANGEKDN